MRKFLLLALAAPFLFTACDSTSNVPVEGILIMPEVHTQVGLTTEMDPSFMPPDATNRTLTWTSTNETVVVVDNSGTVTAVGARVAAGEVTMDTAYITVVTADGGHTDTSLFRVFRFFEDGCNAIAGNSNNFFGNRPPGAITFGMINPNATVVVGNQEWSAPITGCVRGAVTNFTGVTAWEGGSFNADCRLLGSPTINGALYSWCAVVRFGHLMCPPANGWRVPSAEDFAALDRYVRGYGSGRDSYVSQAVVEKYRNAWAWGANNDIFSFPGMITTGSNATVAPTTDNPAPGVTNFGSAGMYWSLTEHSHSGAYFFHIGTNGHVSPNEVGAKSAGRTVRCVRDI